jgi:hypothetical protein
MRRGTVSSTPAGSASAGVAQEIAERQGEREMNICLCGALAGYPHYESCPYPLYRGSERMMVDWHTEFEKLQKKEESHE